VCVEEWIELSQRALHTIEANKPEKPPYLKASFQPTMNSIFKFRSLKLLIR